MSALYDITVKNLEAAGHRVIHAGDDYDHEFTALRDGVPIDLSSVKLWLTIKEDSSQPDSAAKLQYDSETPGGSPNIEITDAVAGEFTVHFRDTDTKGLEGLWPYDIKIRLGAVGAAILRLARGRIEFLPNITREID
jgi:hypothetical protein